LPKLTVQVPGIIDLFWPYNILLRKRILSQGSYYIKQHPEDGVLQIEELKQMLDKDSSKLFTAIFKTIF